MKIGVKLLASFIFVAFLAGVVGLIGIKEIKDTGSDYSELYENYGVTLGYIGEIATAFQQTRVGTRDLLVYKSLKDRNEAVTKITAFDNKITEYLEKCEKKAKLEEEKRLLIKLKGDIDKYNPVRDNIINLMLANEEKKALELMQEGTEFRRLAGNVADSIDKLIEYNISTGRVEAGETRKQTESMVKVMLAIIFLAVLAAVLLGVYISRSIHRPVSKLLAVSEEIAANNLDVSINVSSKDELGVLAKSFGKMAQNINDVLQGIDASAEQVAAASKQVSDSSQALAQGATEQASSVEELTASIEEIAAQTKQNARNATEADELAVRAKENAVTGNEKMQEMLAAMEEINQSSCNISKIIKVIDEIAFQTNILALNAAVEAARAGEHGKGFAVVAEEVRNLAARSASAAKETTEMIEGSIKKVNGGRQIAKDTADALLIISEEVTKVASLLAGIAGASNEQATGISQINQGIMQVSQVTQTNSATAEQSASASEELSSQAEVLRNMVGNFKLKKEGPTSFSELSPDLMRMIEDIKRSEDAGFSGRSARPKITLDNRNFGKY